MEQEVLILSADFWSMADETTGVIREGVSCWYLPTADLKPAVNNEDGTSLGYRPLKSSVDKEFLQQIKKVGCPCKAKATYIMKYSSGKQILAVDKFEIISK